MPSQVIDKDLGWNRIKRDMNKVKNAHTKVGVQGATDNGDESFMAMIARVHEYGAEITVTEKMRRYLHAIGLHLSPNTQTIKIPARSFMRWAFDQFRKENEKLAAQLMGKVIDGDLGPEDALAILGAVHEAQIKNRITNVRRPKLHPFTVARKGSTNPLVGDGHLKESIRHKETFK